MKTPSLTLLALAASSMATAFVSCNAAPPATVPLVREPIEAAPLSEPLPTEPLAAEPLAREPVMSMQGDATIAPDNHLRLSGGFVTTQDSDGPDEEIDFDEGYLIGLGLGHRFGNDADDNFSFLLELEGIWTDQDADDDGALEAVSDVNVIAGFVNGIFDFHLNENWSIYAGGGIGLAGVDASEGDDALNDFDEEDGPFLAWQGRAGLQWWANRRIAWNLGYRFMNIDDVEIDDDGGSSSFDLETQQHILELGLTLGL